MGPLIGILLCECDGSRVSCVKSLELARLLSQLSYRPKYWYFVMQTRWQPRELRKIAEAGPLALPAELWAH